MALLKISNLEKDYTITKTQKQEVLKGINIEFKSGDLVALLGESGCGKSTLINILGGLDTNYTGSVVIKGQYIRDFSEKEMDDYRKKRVGLVFQNYNLIGHQTILENVELAMTISGIDKTTKKERAMDLLRMVGLGNYPDKYPSQLSGGQKQRVAIARALANNPTIILADEPTGALDKDSAEIVMKILRKIAESGKLVIIVTHSQKIAEQCGRVIRLDDGKIVDDRVINKLKIDKTRDKEIKPKAFDRSELFKLSYRNVGRNKKRSMLISFGMSVGIAMMLLILCLSSGLTSYVNNVYSTTALQLSVTNSSYSAITSDEIDSIEEISGVQSVYQTTLVRTATYEYGTSSSGTGVTIMPIVDGLDDFAPEVLYGNLPTSSGQVLIGSDFASTLSTSASLIEVVGQEISISKSDVTQTFIITGIYESTSSGSKMVYCMESDVQSFNSTSNNLLYITVSNVTYSSAVVQDLTKIGYTVSSDTDSVTEVLEYIDLGTSVLTAVGAVSMFVSAIMIFIVLYISVSERINEIGIMRSIGASKKDIRRLFIYEAGILGVIAGLLGIAICLVLTIVVNIVCLTVLSSSLISYNVLYYLLGLLIAVVVSVLSGIAPSMHAAELDPVDCLRAE